MDRRLFLAAVPALAVFPALPGRAQARPLARASASPGGSASISRSGEPFHLRVGRSDFRVGMPPTLHMGNFEIQDLMARSVELRVGQVSVSMTLEEAGSGRFHITGGANGTFRAQTRAQGAAAGFPVLVVSGAAALGRGGQASLGSGRASHGFLLEDQG